MSFKADHLGQDQRAALLFLVKLSARFVMSLLNSPSVALGLVACSGAEGSCWKSGLHAGEVPMQREPNECNY